MLKKSSSVRIVKDALASSDDSAVLLVQRGDGTLYLAIEKDS